MDQPGSTASPFFTPAGSSAASPTPTASPSATSASPSPSPSATNTGTPSPSPAQKLPSSKEIEERWVVVPMRISGSDRPLYLVDSEGKLNQVQLQTPEGGNSNPIMQPSRDTIIYLNAGVLRVMAADGSSDRKLFNRNPAGCRRVEHASWSLSDPNVMLISCRVSKNRVSFLLISMDGRLIRRLDPGKGKVDDASLSPDGQTVLYWASRDQNADGGALFTLPIIGTGAPKQLTKPQGDTDADLGVVA